MSERPSWKKPSKLTPEETISARIKELVDLGRETFYSNRAMRRGGAGIPRDVIFTQKMAIPKKR